MNISDADEKSKLLAQEYVARVERESSFVMDDDLRRIVANTYATAYLRGSADTIEAFVAAYEPQIAMLAKRIAELELMLAAGVAELRARCEDGGAS